MEKKQGSPEIEFDRKKKQYFNKLGLEFRDALKLHKAAGLWERKDGKRDWGNVTEHCLAELSRANVLSEYLGISDDLLKDLQTAAVLHDYYKKQEVERFKSARLSGDSEWDAYEQAQVEAAEGMRKSGFNERVIRLANSVGSGSLIETEEILRKKELSDNGIAYLVMHYVDDISRGDEWVRPAEIRQDGKKINELDRRIDKSEAFPLYKRLNEEGKTYFNGETTFQAQRRIGHLVEERLASLIHERSDIAINPIDLPEFIDQQVKSHIAKLA